MGSSRSPIKVFAPVQGMEVGKRVKTSPLGACFEGCRREAGGSGGEELRCRAAQGTFGRSHPTIPAPGACRPGSGGSVQSLAVKASLRRLRRGRYGEFAQHRIALRDARALPPSHIFSHVLIAVALCRRW